MGLNRTDLDISKFIKAEEMWYGIDRTEGGLGLKIPVRADMVMNKQMVEAQLLLNITEDLLSYCVRAHRGDRKIKEPENLEVDMITAENPANAGIRVIDAGATVKDPYYLKIYLNKTFGICQVNILWNMCSDETLLVHYMNDLKDRMLNGKTAEELTGAAPKVEADKPKLDIAVTFQ
jgi:hypothetical protein